VIAIRRGLSAFGRVRSAAHVMAAQLSAWALQAAVCYVTLLGLGRRASVAAAAVLVAVNVTAVVPLTPSIGVFQAACIAVLAGFGVSATRGLAYGLVLQAVEIAVDLGLGVPALRREGASFDDIRGGARMTGGRRAEPQPPPP
jgi:phosphatidylinositol alpha-mannosyltransferase